MTPTDDLRLLQVFLSREGRGVYETYVSLEDETLSCTCPGFSLRRKCKHTDFIQGRITDTGTYAIEVTTGKLPVGSLPDAIGKPETFRKWVLENGKVEVI